MILRTIRDSHGLEAWRRLVQHYEPSVPGRSVGMLQKLRSPVFRTADLSNWETDWLQWGAEVHWYDSQIEPGGEINDGIKIAVVLGRSPPQIQAFLQLQAGTFANNYQRFREVIASGLESQRRWLEQQQNHSSASKKGGRNSTVDADGPVDMDVSEIHRKEEGRRKSQWQRKDKA